MTVVASVQLGLVRWGCKFKYFLIGGYFTQSFVDSDWDIFNNFWGVVAFCIHIDWLITFLHIGLVNFCFQVEVDIQELYFMLVKITGNFEAIFRKYSFKFFNYLLLSFDSSND